MSEQFKAQLQQLIEQTPALQVLLRLIAQQSLEAWLVGGMVRDLLLLRRIADIDLATQVDPTPLAKQWARQVGGRWFWLDQQRQQSRVLLENLSCDFAPLRAESIGADQALRDFTINSLAFPLHQDFAAANLLDPLHALSHLQQQKLQTCSAQSFVDDPLRMLKGIRHLATLDLTLSVETRGQLQQHAELLKRVAGERIGDELGGILAAEHWLGGIRLLMETGLLTALFGPAGPDWDEGAALAELLALQQQMHLAGWQPDVQSYAPEMSQCYSLRSLFLLATLLKCYAAKNLPDLLRWRLRLSRHQQRLLLALQNQPAASWFAWASSVSGSRRQALLVEQLGDAAEEHLLYLAFSANNLSYQRALELQQSFNQQQKLGRIADLICGEEVRDLLSGQTAGQVIGNWQQQIKFAEIAGQVVTEKDARDLIKAQIRPYLSR